MKILIDADGCPVVDICVSLSKQFNVECIIFCDTAHIFKKTGIQTITVSKGADSVDFAIVNMITKGDIIVTQDYGLAAMCLARNGVPISQNGLIYDDTNIDSMLLARHTAKKIRMSGGRLKGNSKRTKAQNDVFFTALSTLLSE